MLLDSSTVITPSLPTFSMASAISSPMAGSAAETAATCAMASLDSTGLEILPISSTATSTAPWIPFFSSIGFAPAATFLKPSLIMICASRVAVVVPSPATSLVLEATSFTTCAPMFSTPSASSISLAMVTPSLVISGDPKDLLMSTLRPFGPKVIFTVFASWSTPACNFLLASSP